MADCIFCKIVAGDIPSNRVFEDEQVIVFKDINPKADVHLLMVPKLHVASLDELDAAQHSAMLVHMMLLLPKLARAQGLDEGYRTIINTGPAGGQEVFHLHIHLLGGSHLPGF